MKPLCLSLLALLLLAPPARAALHLRSAGPEQNFLYERDSKALASSVFFVVRTGSLADPQGKEGLASLSFASLLRGTKDKSRPEFFAAMERLGASVSSVTGTNRTILTLDAISENLEPALALLGEAILQPALGDAEINSLKTEQQAQINQELANNRAVLKRALRLALYRGTPLAFPPNGTAPGLAAAQPQDVRAFLAAQLKAGNILVAALSNHPEKKVRAAIEKIFAGLPEGTAPPTPPLDLQPVTGRRLYLVERGGSSTSELGIAQRWLDSKDPKRDALEMGLEVFGGPGNSLARLFQELRAKKGWTYGAYGLTSFLETPRRHGGSFVIYAFPQAEFTKDATLRALELYGDFVKSGVTGPELSFSRQSLTNAYPFKTANAKARLTARVIEQLDGAPLLSQASYRAKLARVSTKSLRGDIQKVHDAKNLAIVLVGEPAQLEATRKVIPNLTATLKISDVQKELPGQVEDVKEPSDTKEPGAAPAEPGISTPTK